jgi:hypothetical protein
MDRNGPLHGEYARGKSHSLGLLGILLGKSLRGVIRGATTFYACESIAPDPVLSG